MVKRSVVQSVHVNDQVIRANGVNGPVRTCVGCRKRALAADLVRVVAEAAGSSRSASRQDAARGAVQVLLDPRGRAGGRGAWLHRDPRCLQQAQRRRSFPRALKVSERIDDALLVVRFTEEFGTEIDQPKFGESESKS